MKYWLMKSEPEVYSIRDLARDKTTWWEGVRNYQARNFMRDDMKPGDLVLFYHSNAEPSGVAGVARVSKPAAPDKTAENPTWVCVQVEFVEEFSKFIDLQTIRNLKSLEKMVLLQKGSRLSVQPVKKQEFETVLKLGRGK